MSTAARCDFAIGIVGRGSSLLRHVIEGFAMFRFGIALLLSTGLLRMGWSAEPPLDELYHAHNSCGVVSLYVALQLLEVDVDLKVLYERCPIGPDGSSVRDLVGTCDSFSLDARALSANVAYLRSLAGPAIIDFPRHHFSVLLGWNGGKAMIFDYL